MDDRGDIAASDESAWKALASLRGLVIEQESRKGLEAAIDSIRERLLVIEASESVRLRSQGRFHAVISPLFKRSLNVDAVEDWLARTGQFDKKKVQRIRRIRLFSELENGKVVLRDQPVSEAAAAVGSALLCLVAGAWISWVWFASEGNIQLILLSFCLGLVAGNLSGILIDRSFRFAKLRREVLDFAPWLEGGVTVSNTL